MNVFGCGKARCFLLTCIFTFMSVSLVNANPMDELRQIFDSGRFTIRYDIENSTIQDQLQKIKGLGTITENGITNSYGYEGRQKYFIVSDGDTTFVQATTKNDGRENGRCWLLKTNKVYDFIYADGKYVSFHGKNIPSRSLNESDVNLMYGDSYMLNAVNAMYGDKKTDKYGYKFQLAGEGTNKEGQQYYDYEAVFSGKNENYYVFRYMFEQGKLVKIACAEHYNLGGAEHNRRIVIRVSEISPIPEQQYLYLPKGFNAVD